jgi:hypothetical protein
MAAPGVSVQLFYSLDHPGSHRIEMDIPDQNQEITILIAEDGFVPVFKQVAGSPVAAIVVLGIPGQLFSHDG